MSFRTLAWSIRWKWNFDQQFQQKKCDICKVISYFENAFHGESINIYFNCEHMYFFMYWFSKWKKSLTCQILKLHVFWIRIVCKYTQIYRYIIRLGNLDKWWDLQLRSCLHYSNYVNFCGTTSYFLNIRWLSYVLWASLLLGPVWIFRADFGTPYPFQAF